MRIITLTRISSDHFNLRTITVTGFTPSKIVKSERIYILTKPLDKSFNFRLITTSPITKIGRGPNKGILWTEYSKYKYNIRRMTNVSQQTN